MIELAVIGCDHSALCAVHEHSHPAQVGFEPVAEWADEIRTDQSDSIAQDLGMNRVVNDRADRLASRRNGLDNAHARIVEFWSVVVVGNLSLGVAGGDL